MILTLINDDHNKEVDSNRSNNHKPVQPSPIGRVKGDLAVHHNDEGSESCKCQNGIVVLVTALGIHGMVKSAEWDEEKDQGTGKRVD